jgi:hypothetical protein
MRLVQGRRMQHDLDSRHTAAQEIAIDDRAQVGGEGPGDRIDADDRVSLRLQGAHQGLAEMAGAAGNQDLHDLSAVFFEGGEDVVDLAFEIVVPATRT